MKKIDINDAIAKACGWTKGRVRREWGKPDTRESWGWTPPEGWLYSDSRFAKSYRDDRESGVLHPPDYFSDLNACYEMEKILHGKPGYRSEKWARYERELYDLCRGLESFGPYHATAAQRAEAFLRCLNLWED